MTKLPVSLLLAAVLAAPALPLLAQQTAAPAPAAAAPAAAAPAATAPAATAPGAATAPAAASPAAGAAPAAASAALAATPAASATPPGPAAATPAPTAPAAVAAAATGKPDAALGEQKYNATCVGCHGPGGNNGTPANPKLAQQHPEYIVKQLQEYKSGRRPNPVMQGFATPLSDQDMKNIAAFLGGQKARNGFARDKDLVALGEKIYRGGIQSRQLAACSGCHSPNGAGIPAQYPRLSGQHADYIAGQLVAFRDGARKNSPQMSQIAFRMNDREIRAVADYIAGLR